jgi:hypothetical protein
LASPHTHHGSDTSEAEGESPLQTSEHRERRDTSFAKSENHEQGIGKEKKRRADGQ